MPARADNAATFHRLHQGPDILLLANAWDGGSARLIESLGAKAVATTSAGVAWAHGYPDGDALPLRLLLSTVTAITRIVRVPLTVDMEGGYGETPAAVGEAVGAVIEAGGVGINIEDGSSPPDRRNPGAGEALPGGRRKRHLRARSRRPCRNPDDRVGG
jgi:2-methylisocitrate lyase-like PEP mutase family enzyme